MRSVLETDGYKLSMAEAGWPLRPETFVYQHRKGGAQLLPLDVERAVRAALPTPSPDDLAYLATVGYEMGAGFKAAMLRHDAVTVRALPKGAWFLPREPVFTVSGPSALVSWLEPLLLQLSYRVQVATLARTDPAALAGAVGTVTCEEQRAIVLETLDAVGVAAPEVRVDEDGYRARVFEVGLRAASCTAQHMVALAACKEAGVERTSHVLGARRLGMTPVGTMGHEHVQRYGDDDDAFRAMRERRPGRSSYLLDTFDTLRSGLPAALAILEEDPSAGDSIRYDSGDKLAQYRHAVAEARRRGVRPVHILEDGFDAELTRAFEREREALGVPPGEQFYGYGGFLVSDGALTRDRVSAVYKLSRTGRRDVMKFADEAGEGKRSLPGRPVVWRRVSGDGPDGIVGQEGEPVADGYALATGATADLGRPRGERVELGPATRALVERCARARQEKLDRAKEASR